MSPYSQVLPKFKSGKLRAGDRVSGKIVTNPKQAMAIMIAEKKKAAGGDPEYQSSGSTGINPSPNAKSRMFRGFMNKMRGY